MLCSIPYFDKVRIVGRCTRIPPWIHLASTFTLPEYHMNTSFCPFLTEENCDMIIMTIKDAGIVADEVAVLFFFPYFNKGALLYIPMGCSASGGAGRDPARPGIASASLRRKAVSTKCPPIVHRASTNCLPFVHFQEWNGLVLLYL